MNPHRLTTRQGPCLQRPAHGFLVRRRLVQNVEGPVEPTALGDIGIRGEHLTAQVRNLLAKAAPWRVGRILFSQHFPGRAAGQKRHHRREGPRRRGPGLQRKPAVLGMRQDARRTLLRQEIHPHGIEDHHQHIRPRGRRSSTGKQNQEPGHSLMLPRIGPGTDNLQESCHCNAPPPPRLP